MFQLNTARLQVLNGAAHPESSGGSLNPASRLYLRTRGQDAAKRVQSRRIWNTQGDKVSQHPSTRGVDSQLWSGYYHSIQFILHVTFQVTTEYYTRPLRLVHPWDPMAVTKPHSLHPKLQCVLPRPIVAERLPGAHI